MDRIRKFSMRGELTERELNVIKLVADGKTSEESSRELGVAVCTIKHHISAALTKTQTNNRPSLVAYAFRNGLIS